MNVQPYIETVSGSRFWLLDDRPAFLIGDIAGALSKTCRYGGHCETFYSVAEHSVLVSEIMEKQKLGDPFEGLMHDASEAYLCDIPGPWKCLLPDYRALEANLEAKLRLHFELPEKSAGCKHADLIALMVEGRLLCKSRGDSMIEGGIPAEYGPLADEWIAKHGRSVFCLTPRGAEIAFLHRYDKLMRRRK